MEIKTMRNELHDMFIQMYDGKFYTAEIIANTDVSTNRVDLCILKIDYNIDNIKKKSFIHCNILIFCS